MAVIPNKDLYNVRLRHAALIAVNSHIKTYVECLERGYYGKIAPHEQKLIETLRNLLAQEVENSLWKYYEAESEFTDV